MEWPFQCAPNFPLDNKRSHTRTPTQPKFGLMDAAQT